MVKPRNNLCLFMSPLSDRTFDHMLKNHCVFYPNADENSKAEKI